MILFGSLGLAIYFSVTEDPSLVKYALRPNIAISVSGTDPDYTPGAYE